MQPANRIEQFFCIEDREEREQQPESLLIDDEKFPPTALEEKQALLSHHVRLVARRKTNGLFVAGSGGLGKSKTIAETLASEGITPVLLNSHVTPLSLYATLYAHRAGRIIWLDDADSIYTNMMVLGLLRSALWGQGERIVTYTSTQLPDDLPPAFDFDSRIIFCANTLPKRNEAFKAVLSRVDCFTLDATNAEIIQQMRKMADEGNGTLTPIGCHDLVDFIEEFGGTRRLSMRLYEPSCRKVEYALTAGIDWRDLVRSQLEQLGGNETTAKQIDSKQNDLAMLREAQNQFPHCVKDQQELWCKATGKSRASFYRIKKEQAKKRKK